MWDNGIPNPTEKEKFLQGCCRVCSAHGDSVREENDGGNELVTGEWLMQS